MRATHLALAVLASASVAEPQAAGQLVAPAARAPETDAAIPPPPATSEPPAAYGIAGGDAAARPARRPPRGGYMPELALLVPGAIAFVNTYGGAVLAAIETEIIFGGSEITDWLYVPCVGPFVLVGYADGVPDAQAVFFALGLFQTASLAFIVTGLAINRRAGREEEEAVSVAPFVSPTASGLAVSGRW